MDERTHKRIIGLARFWHKRFRLPYDYLDDLINQAWVLWLERPTVEAERRFNQLNSGLRRYILTELYGRVPHQGKIPEPVLFRDSAHESCRPDFTGRVRLREVTDACAAALQRKGHAKPQDHLATVAMLAGLRPEPKAKTFKERRARLRKFLQEHGLAA